MQSLRPSGGHLRSTFVVSCTPHHLRTVPRGLLAQRLFATGKAFEELSLRAALLDEGRRKAMDVQGLRVWEHATREILEPAGLITIGDVLALPVQDVDIEARTSKEGLASRAKQLRELALPSGLLRYLVQVRAGQHDASLSELASTLESRRPANAKEGDAAQPEAQS